MGRRRRPQREIAFSFDSFLDLVANVVGIILRLILVTWVGARSYHAIVPPPSPPPPAAVAEDPLTLPEPTDPLQEQLVRQREELAQTAAGIGDRQRQAGEVHAVADQLRRDLGALSGIGRKMQTERDGLVSRTAERRRSLSGSTLTLTELRRRSQTLLAEVDRLKQLPPARKELRYRTPVSAPVQTEEVMFECRYGRVALIDTGTMLDEVRREARSRAEGLKTQWQVSATTQPIGAFRLRYVLERQREMTDGLPGTAPLDTAFRYALTTWEVEPIIADRGEGTDRALEDGSAFRKVIDALDPQQTAVTLWVYADSFASYRRLRDHLHDRDIVVAGRPLPDGMPIASSRRGSHSRGQ